MNEPVYTGPLEPVVHHVLQAAQGYFVRTGKHPTARNTPEIMRDVLETLPAESLLPVVAPDKEMRPGNG